MNDDTIEMSRDDVMEVIEVIEAHIEAQDTIALQEMQIDALVQAMEENDDETASLVDRLMESEEKNARLQEALLISLGV